jgi:hypothetical protein
LGNAEWRAFGSTENLARFCSIACKDRVVTLPRICAKYGMTVDDYLMLLAQQGGCCAICRQAPIQRRLVIDHDHETGQVRGLLCSGCNVGLGNLGDTLAGLQRAVAYLQENPTKRGCSASWNTTQ